MIKKLLYFFVPFVRYKKMQKSGGWVSILPIPPLFYTFYHRLAMYGYAEL